MVFQRIYSNIRNIFSGGVDVLDILLADDALVKLSMFTRTNSMGQNSLNTLSHTKPNQLVLELALEQAALRQHSEDVDT